MKQKDDEFCGVANMEILGLGPKVEVHQGPEVDAVTDTQPSRGDGWCSWNAVTNGNFFCDGNEMIRGQGLSAATE
jgi:hypothetical protein